MRRDRGEKRSKIMVFLMGFIMVASVFGVAFFGFSGGANTVRDKGLKFTSNGDYLSTKINGREAVFNYLPSNVEDVPIDDGVIDRLKNAIEIDTTSDFNDTLAGPIALAQFQMAGTLNSFNVFVRNGFTSKQQNFDAITCKDAAGAVPVIYFKSSNETRVYLEDNCIIAGAANSADVLWVKDRLVYGVLGVIG